MKRIIPVLVVFVLIAVIMVAGPGRDLIDEIRYSDDKADLKDYYDLSGEDQAAIIMDNAVIEEKALVKNNRFYLPIGLVKTVLNKNFYLDDREGLLLYTTPDTIYAVDMGGSFYYVYGEQNGGTDTGSAIVFKEGEETYIALDYVRTFTNFQADTYDDPYRVEIDNKYEERQVAFIKKDTNIRYQGGVKSKILTDVSKGDEVVVLEEMDNWTKVKKDAFLGYVENKRLTETESYKPDPVKTYQEPEFTHIEMSEKVCLGWHQVASAESAISTLSQVTEHTQGMNVISPTWFSLSDNEGNFSSMASTQYVAQAHQRGLQVWGLVDNFNTSISSFEILSRTSVRTRLAAGLIQAAIACGMDGINIDFEQLSSDTGEHFAQFIRELSVACRREGLVLSVDNYVPQGGTDFYRRDVQGEYADYVVIMGYDEHWAGMGEPGSVASIDYVELGITMTLKQAPPERIINGVPFYTRVWSTTPSGVTDQALGMADAQEFLRRHNATATWDDVTCQNYAQFQEGDTIYQVWMEDEQSIETKLNIMNSYELAGVAIWKLGFEGPSVWNVVDGYLHG